MRFMRTCGVYFSNKLVICENVDALSIYGYGSAYAHTLIFNNIAAVQDKKRKRAKKKRQKFDHITCMCMIVAALCKRNRAKYVCFFQSSGIRKNKTITHYEYNIVQNTNRF